MSFLVRFIVLANNYLQIKGIKKTDEGTYRCEGRILARGEINFKDIQVIVNGEEMCSSCLFQGCSLGSSMSAEATPPHHP